MLTAITTGHKDETQSDEAQTIKFTERFKTAEGLRPQENLCNNLSHAIDIMVVCNTCLIQVNLVSVGSNFILKGAFYL